MSGARPIPVVAFYVSNTGVIHVDPADLLRTKEAGIQMELLRRLPFVGKPLTDRPY